MSCRAMVTSPFSSAAEHRSATKLRVNSTLPAPMIAIRIMSGSVPWSYQMSKCAHRVRRPSSRPWRWSDLRDPHARVREPSKGPCIGGVIGDQLTDRPDFANSGERHQPDLGAVGHYHNRPGALNQCPVRVSLHLVMGREAGLEGDPVSADEHNVKVESRQTCLGKRPDQLVGL